MDAKLNSLTTKIGQLLQEQKLHLVTAESCTGGLVAASITAIPNSSQYFERGFVTYSNVAKQELLGVQASTLETHGAVSEATAREMAEGALQNSKAEIALAVTGIAGPGGGSSQKPVGTVCFAWARVGTQTITDTHFFIGDRTEVRWQATEYLLSKLLEQLG